MSLRVVVSNPEEFTARVVVPLPSRRSALSARTPAATVDVVVPVYNEERDLEQSGRRPHAFLSTDFPFTWEINIANNASTDLTASIAGRLQGSHVPFVALLAPTLFLYVWGLDRNGWANSYYSAAVVPRS